MNDCICTALFTNLDCKKHARPYLLSFHRALPGSIIRLEVLASAFRHEDYFGHWPTRLYIRRDQWDEIMGTLCDPPDATYDSLTQTGLFLGMETEFIPKGALRVGDRRYV